MLLSAGYSLGAALNRIAARGAGAVGRDLRRVGGRIRQGLSEVDALREWAALVDVDAVDRLVAVLALNREAGDLGRLIAEEARSIRREVQRELIETIERRGQQVWIPVTVATLVPGVLFLAVPVHRGAAGVLRRVSRFDQQEVQMFTTKAAVAAHARSLPPRRSPLPGDSPATSAARASSPPPSPC